MAAREHYRALDRRPVSLQAVLASDAGGWQHPARVIDLGLGGACVELASPVETGSGVRLTVVAPNLWDPLVVEGTLVWSDPQARPPRAGIRFEHDSGVTLRALVELLGRESYE